MTDLTRETIATKLRLAAETLKVAAFAVMAGTDEMDTWAIRDVGAATTEMSEAMDLWRGRREPTAGGGATRD